MADALRVLVRTAASGTTGAGHVARTSAVARALVGSGAGVKWACDPATEPYLAARGIAQRDIQVLAGAATEGKSGETELDAVDQERDAWLTLQAACDFRPQAILLDTYLLGAAWQGIARENGIRLAVFDDLADRQVDADVLINAAAERRDYASIAPRATALCGLSYAVTSGEQAAAPRFDEPGAVLVAFGASDRGDATSRVLTSLDQCRGQRDGAEVWVQLGAGAPHRHAVESLVARLGWARMLHPAQAIDARSRGIGVAVGAAGVSLYERMRDGIPCIVMPLAQNQRRIAEAAAACGAARLVDDAEGSACMALRIRTSLQDLRGMSAAGRDAVDGMGAKRIADIILSCFG